MTESELLATLSTKALPAHVAIIMDGNGRWANQRMIPRFQGHRKAVRAVRAVVEAAAELELQVLTLYAFSTENWSRPHQEVSMLMRLFEEFLQKELSTLLKNNIRFSVIGNRSELPDFLDSPINQALSATQENTGLTLNLAINYGGRAEIIRAVQSIAQLVQEGQLTPGDIDESLFSQYTYTNAQPDPDLIIRTSGEKRISNFLLWQSAYAEYYFTEVLWPDFARVDFYKGLHEFQQRQRRLGDVAPPTAKE